MKTTQVTVRGILVGAVRGILVAAIAAIAATSVAAVPGSLAAAPHIRPALPNLTANGGSVRVAGLRVLGSFTVRNSGRSRAGRSQATLSIMVGRKRRSLGAFAVAPVRAGAKRKIVVSVRVPAATPAGSYPVLACADTTHRVSASSERDNCAKVGQLRLSSSSAPSGSTAPTGSIPPTGMSTPTGTAIATTPTPTAPPKPGPTQVPTAPMTIAPDTPTLVHDSYDGTSGSYFVTTPPGYDVTGNTPMRLLVWMHGCGGEADGDSYEMIASNELDAHGDPQDDESRDFIVISIGGTDGGCWNPDTEVIKVLMAVADVTTHFNVDRRHIFIAGYSSGGDLSYRTIFYNADEFAGILAVNTHPFRDTGSTESQSTEAAAWKFNIAQVAHPEDTEYHPSPCTNCLEGGGNDPGVTPAMSDLSSDGYRVEYLIKPGTHFDEDNFAHHTGTFYDFRQYVLPFIDAPGWESPGS